MSKHFVLRPSSAARRQRGITLIETLCASSVLATALSLAAPAVESWRLRQALDAEAATLETDIQLARSSAVALNRTVRLETLALGNSSCYVVHTGDAHACQCDGQGSARCADGAQILRVAAQPMNGTVRVANSPLSIAFDPVRGTVTPTATLKFVDSRGRALHQVVNVMGRVRTCSPQGSVSGARPC